MYEMSDDVITGEPAIYLTATTTTPSVKILTNSVRQKRRWHCLLIKCTKQFISCRPRRCERWDSERIVKIRFFLTPHNQINWTVGGSKGGRVAAHPARSATHRIMAGQARPM